MNIQQLLNKIDRFFDEQSAKTDIEMFETLIYDATINDDMNAEEQIKCVNYYVNRYFEGRSRFGLLSERNKKLYKSFMIISLFDLNSYIEEARTLSNNAIEQELTVLAGKQDFKTKRFNEEDFWFVNEVITNIINTEMNTKDNRFTFKSDENQEVFKLVLTNKKKEVPKTLLFKK